jgi:hypothetical protein
VKRGVCLTLAALLAASACGGSGHGRLSKSAYEAKLRSAFSAASTELKAKPRVAGSPEFIMRIANAYGGIASSLRGERPPTDVQALNDRLVAGASAAAAALKALAATLEGATKVERERLLAQFDASRIAGQQEFDRAVAGLVAKGYKFRPNAGR